MIRYITILLAILGVSLAVYVVATAKEPIPSPPPAQPPSTNPFPSGIAALGLVEPATRTIDIAAPEPGRVAEVYVQVNDVVKADDPLFKLDTTLLEAELLSARAAKEAAEADVQRLENWPRSEDFPPVEAEVTEASLRLADAQERLATMETALKRGAASDDEVSRQRFLVSILKATLTNAEARLARMKSGSWNQDIAVAQALVEAREADIQAIGMRIDRLTIRAPRAGTILQRSIEPGEWAASSSPNMPGTRTEVSAPLILADLTDLQVRAQVDEEDMPLIRPGAKAFARIRGAMKIEVPLAMVRIEPYARPKSQISGASTELIDTRVVEVIFKAMPGPAAPPMYPGQVVDVYIETTGEAAPSASPPGGTVTKAS